MSNECSGACSGSSSVVVTSIRLDFRCSGCSRRQCAREARCIGKDMIPNSGQLPFDPVCAGCGNSRCPNLVAYGADCFGYRGGVEKAVYNMRMTQFGGHFYEDFYQ